MNEKELKKIISVFKRNSFLSELEFEESGTKIKLKRGADAFSIPREAISAQDRNIQKKDDPFLMPEQGKNLQKIEAPMVGTFYRSPSPNSKPFVEVGDTVHKGKVVCIIEAMKLMNEIESELDGKIIEILPNDGNPVEYGEPLFLLEPM